MALIDLNRDRVDFKVRVTIRVIIKDICTDRKLSSKGKHDDPKFVDTK